MIRAAVFDFDGVVLESAEIKTRAFRRLFERFPEHVEAIVAHHVANSGVSRFEKFRFVYREILGLALDDEQERRLGEEFSALVLDEILRCPFVAGARELLERRSTATALFVASGTPQEELRGIVAARGLESCFRGVYGTPATKAEILARILHEHALDPGEAIFVGDATTDLEGARAVGVPFVGRVRAGDASPFDGEEVVVVADLGELDRLWEALAAQPPPIPHPHADR